MPKWLNTRGNSVLSIAICGRCKFKRAYTDLKSDPNFVGLLVCRNVKDGCLDVLDPWRLNARQTEVITLNTPRPDLDISIPGGVPQIPQRN